MPEELPTPERARELLRPMVADYRHHLDPARDDDSPMGIWASLQGKWDDVPLLDAAEMIRTLAEVSGEMDTPIDELLEGWDE